MSQEQQFVTARVVNHLAPERLTEDERHRVLWQWNATELEYSRDSALHTLIEAQARRTPDKVAVRFEDQQLSYAELDARANQLARYLKKLGAGPEVLVGICLERSLEMLVALLGILKAGSAYVPLDPSFPRNRLALILEDSQVKIFICQKNDVHNLLPVSARHLCLAEEWPQILLEKETSLDTAVAGHNLAYVLYTSGSTGKPKGVQIEHHSLVNFMCAMRRCPGIAADDVLLAVTTISFDIAGLELYLPLTVGAEMVLASRKVACDASLLAATIAESGATVMQATPATWRLLLDGGWQGNRQLKILCGGEQLPSELAKQLLPRCASLWNMYGPTETTIWSSIYKVEGEIDRLLPIGRPIANTQMYILDAELNPAPVGVEGELYIGGGGIARGYLNRPDLTSEKFIPNPFQTSGRLYRTGDLARYLPDGNIIFLGRMDHQVKIRGFRIELGEIEAALAEHHAVRQNVVVARQGETGESRLVAYVVANNGVTPEPHDLRVHLQRTLPDYMLPSAYVQLQAMPLTPNGKVDRLALPDPKPVVAVAQHDCLPPRNANEVQLLQLWEKVLKVSPIGVRTNFFELGASSLDAARLITQIAREFKKDLPLSVLYDAPNIEQMAALLETRRQATGWRSLVPIQPHGSKPPFFCVHGGGGGILFTRNLIRHLDPDQPFYGLQAEAVHGRRISSRRVEDMAAHYIREIRTVARHGPYLLGGYCFGGIVAFEMARQLSRAGLQVKLVALFNAANPAMHIADGGDDENVVNNVVISEQQIDELRSDPRIHHSFLRHWKELRQRRLRNSPAYLYRALSSAVRWRLAEHGIRPQRLRRIGNKLLEAGCVTYARLGGRVPPGLRRHYILAITHWSERHYVPQVYSSAITVFSGEGLYPEPTAGWQGLAADGVETCVIPCQNRSFAGILREPAVRTLARELTARLARVQQAVSHPR